MAKVEDDWWTLEQCLAHIMRAQGKTRRQAKAALLKELRAGNIAAIGDNPETGRTELIPKDCWPSVN
jgi:hypothetical protein